MKARISARAQSDRDRIFACISIRIYYLSDRQGVSIERVLDGRRDVTRIIELGVEDPPDWQQ